MELDGAFPGALDFKDARRAITVESDLGIREVVGQDNPVIELKPASGDGRWSSTLLNIGR
jgi:hypothetical protein